MGKYLINLDCFAANEHGEWKIDFRKFNITCAKMVAMFYFYKQHHYLTHSFGKAIVKLHKFLKEQNELPPERFQYLSREEGRELYIAGNYHYINEIEDFLGVCTIHRKFDFDKYFAADDFAQQKMILDEIYQGMLLLSDHFAWDQKPLENAYQRCLEKNLIFQWTALARKFSRNKQFSGEIFIDFQRYEIQIFAIIRDKNGNEIQREIIDTFNGLENTNRIFPDDIVEITRGKTKWGNNEFVVLSKKGNEIARIKM